MAAASDKARFFLEQSVPELKELEKKKIFTAEEISKIARQRSDFEHKINARGSTATDYLRYAEFETNVDALRKKRMKRMGIRSTSHNGQRRIFFVLDRATKKHPSDVGLWLQAIEYAKAQKANKKLQQLFTSVLRLHPTRPELWIYAAQFAMEENGNMTEARGYMQRGLRFNKNKKSLWTQYLRLEMSYIAKIQARREILGIAAAEADSSGRAQEAAPASITTGDVVPEEEGDQVDSRALQALDNVPAQSGAIPIAVFDAAMEQFDNDEDVVAELLKALEDYEHLEVLGKIVRHIRNTIDGGSKKPWLVCICDIWLPVIGMTPNSEAFPAAFRSALQQLRSAQKQFKHSLELSYWAKRWLQRIAEVEDLDPALLTVATAVSQTL
ncbi:U3 small nucleolar RNA-associated protein 6 [Cyphellophora attinorum]|uniref:U3 small nucleolar RNA-associated protein 6 n=1 Tax=Cyphellophora attinorum TaxID=1664694 RepID=A0A0N0NQU2_9EURO|nr:U3 small nucleolar RNA-associated protein 6 [Phialophora attinorum]KPI44321.1 U3 small nucleolar RNA-associated protein 6 [Phialophora attinorum]